MKMGPKIFQLQKTPLHEAFSCELKFRVLKHRGQMALNVCTQDIAVFIPRKLPADCVEVCEVVGKGRDRSRDFFLRCDETNEDLARNKFAFPVSITLIRPTIITKHKTTAAIFCAM
jgi:hypothetical protein